MNRDAILALEERELDFALAEAFGWEWWRKQRGGIERIAFVQDMQGLLVVHSIGEKPLPVYLMPTGEWWPAPIAPPTEEE